jgi:predicted O-methyltransferase YrrM
MEGDNGFFKYHADMLKKWEEVVFPIFSEPVSFLEIEQVFDGSYTNFILNHLPENSNATCIDTWENQDDTFNQFIPTEQIVLKRGPTMEMLLTLTDKQYDIIYFLMGDKTNAREYLDLFHTTLLKNGGVLVLNDHLYRGKEYPHNVDIVNKFLEENKDLYRVLYLDYHIFLQKN